MNVSSLIWALEFFRLHFSQLMSEEFIRFFIQFRLVDQPHRGPQFGTLALHKEAFPFTYSVHRLFGFPSSPLERVKHEKHLGTKGTESMSDWISISHCCQQSGQQVPYNMVSLCFHLAFSSPPFKPVNAMLTWGLILQNTHRWKVYWFSKGLWIPKTQFTGRSLSEHVPGLFIL